MANRKNTFLIKRSNVAGKVPAAGDLQLGELALNTADNILYASGTTANSILPIGWDRVARTGDTMTGYLYAPSISATTISATTYYNLPTDIFTTGGTYSNITGIATFTNNSGGTFNVAGFSTGGSSVFTGGTVTGPTVFTSGLSANTISATTYYNLPTDVFVTGGTYSSGSATFINNTGGTFSVTGFSTGSTTNIGSGTINYLPKWTGSTALGNSLIRDDGTNIGVNTAPSSTGKVSIYTLNGNTSALYVQNQNLSSSYGVYAFLNSGQGSQTAVFGVAEGHPTTGTSIGLLGFANDGLLGIGVKGAVGTTEFGSMATGIGGSFDGRGDGGYGYPATSYSVQLLDGTEGINKVLVSQTSDGKANWSSVLSGLTGVYTNTISATTYQNLPTDVFVTGGTYTSGNAIFTNNTGGTFTVSGFNVGGGGGQVFYLNLSQSQNGNRLLSTTASTASEQTSGVTIANGVTSTIASFQSQPLNITLLPGGIWSFYLHSYKENSNATFNIFVEVYKRTSGGTETLLFATDPAPVTTNSPNPSMQLSDGYFSGTSLNVSDSVVSVVRATNTGNQSHIITLVTEGSAHYSYVVSTIPTQQGLTCDTLSGCSIIQTIQTDISNKFDKSGGTVNGATNFTNGLSATTISATTYQNLPTDVRVTGATYSNNTFNFTNNTGGTFNVLFNTLTGLTVNGSMSANHVYVVSATTGTSVANLGIQSDGKIIKAGGNAIVDNFYYSVSNSTDTTFFEDDKVRLKWDETGNDLKFTMKVEPSGSGDMRSLGVLMGSNTTFNVAIVTPNFEYDLYSAGISAGNRMEAFVTAENDQTYPAYHITAYNTGESFQNTIWVKRITRI